MDALPGRPPSRDTDHGPELDVFLPSLSGSAWSRARVGAALVLVVAVACKREAAEADDDKPAAVAVTCQPVVAATIDDTVEVTGVIAPPPRLDAIVSSPIAGRVGLVNVEEGDRVAAGAVLAVIEDPTLPAGSLEAKAAVAVAQAQRAAAELEVGRQQRLVDVGIGARKDLDDAHARATAAAAELDAANARAGLATSQLARRELRAPRGGVVLHVWRRVGESVDGTTATPVAEVADLATLELHAQVSTSAIARLADKQHATVRVIGLTMQFAATVVRVAPAVDPATLLGGVRLAIDPASAGLAGVKVGSAAIARIVIASRPGVLVPPTALRRSMVGADEVVVCDGEVARVAAVAIGQRGEGGVEIIDGLAGGQRIVVDHVLGLEDGQHLTPAGKPVEGVPEGKGADKAAADKAAADKAAVDKAAADKAGDGKAPSQGSGH